MAAAKADSATLSAIDQALAKVPAGSERHRALTAARAFKASWLGLGEALAGVHKSRSYRGWGYSQFAAYCRQELHIREETAQKVVRSFAFLQEHAPAALAKDRVGPAPNLDVVDLLRRAHGQTRVDPEAWRTLTEQTVSHAKAPVSRTELRGRLQSAFPETFAPPPASAAGVPPAESPGAEPSEPSAAPPVDPGHARKVLLLAERLHALLAEQPNLACQGERDAILALAKQLRRHARLPAGKGGGQQNAAKLYSEGQLH